MFRKRFLVAAVAISAVLFTSIGQAQSNGKGKGKGNGAVVNAVVSCGPRLVTTTAEHHAISNLVLVTAGGEIKLESDFEGVELYSFDIDPTSYNNLTGIYIKAGNNGERGKGNQGKGELVTFNVDATCDPDGDGVDTADGDNCPALPNPHQEDLDMDGNGDVCDMDADGDGFDDGFGPTADCDDMNAAINPDALEVVGDMVDNDCDGHVDESDSTTFSCYAYWDQDGRIQSDADQDAAMDAACEAACSGSRAATIDEIVSGITGIPVINDSGSWLLGKCPNCEGASDAGSSFTTIEGYGRNCVTPDAAFPSSLPWIEEDFCVRPERSAACVF